MDLSHWARQSSCKHFNLIGLKLKRLFGIRCEYEAPRHFYGCSYGKFFRFIEALHVGFKHYLHRFEVTSVAYLSVFIDADGDGNAECYGGPVWAIVDDAAAKRNDWVMEQGVLDFEGGYAFKADTIEELAQKIVNKLYY